MARLHHRPARRRAVARRLIAVAIAGGLLVTSGCTTPSPAAPEGSEAPERPVAEIMRDEITSVFDAVYGDGAVRAVLIQQHGEPVYEQYWTSTPDDTWDIRGVTRCIVSTLVGIAIDRGLIRGVDATLGELLPSYAASLTGETASIELKAVLTSTAFFPSASEQPDLLTAPDLQGASDWVAAILDDRASRDPGDGVAFLSSEVGAHILAAVLAEATRMSPLQFAHEALFAPLGVEAEPLWEERVAPGGLADDVLRSFEDAGVAWLADPQGINFGYAHLRMRPTDLVRIGQLFLDEGTWDGEQVVSPTWAVEATSPHVATRGYGAISFGYQWWIDPEAGVFFAEGEGGTALVVDPARDAVAVVASEVRADDHRATKGFAASTAVGLAVALLDELPPG